MNFEEARQWAKDQEQIRLKNPPICNNPRHAGICFAKDGKDLNGRDWK
jgi:hypothetical protein